MGKDPTMVFHSDHNEDSATVIGGLPLLPFKSDVKGPARAPTGVFNFLTFCEASLFLYLFSLYLFTIDDKPDIIEETLTFFRANVFFRTFEFKGPADRLLVYLTLFTTQCLQACDKQASRSDANMKVV